MKVCIYQMQTDLLYLCMVFMESSEWQKKYMVFIQWGTLLLERIGSIAGCHCSVVKVFMLMGCCVALVGIRLLTKLEAIPCPKMSVTDYQPMLRNISEEQRPSIKWSHNFMIALMNVMWFLQIEHSQWLEARVLKRWFEFYKFGCRWIMYTSLHNVLAEFICQVHSCYTCWM